MMPKGLREYWAKKKRARAARRSTSKTKRVAHMGRRKKIALAPLIGFGLGAAVGLKKLADAYASASSSNSDPDPMNRLVNQAMWQYAGISRDGEGNFVFNAKGLLEGTVPLIVGGVGGWLAHKAATRFGVNRSIPWFAI